MDHLYDIHTLSALLAGAAVFSAVMFVSWPYFSNDSLDVRMRQIEGERERIRLKERSKVAMDPELSLTRKPSKFYQALVDQFDLAKQADSGKMAARLRMAGFRGQAPMVTFLAIRLISPLVIFLAITIYIPVVFKPDLPFLAIVVIAAAIGSLGHFVPGIYVSNRIANRQKSIRRTWPDALDLMLIAVESGMSVEAAFRKVAQEIGPQSVELAEELSITTAELSYLQNRRQAFVNLADRTGLDGVKAVVTALIQAEKYGTAVGQALRVMAKENRDMRMNEAERKAAALPPKLTVPMIIFFLPTLFAVVMTPAILQVAGLR